MNKTAISILLLLIIPLVSFAQADWNIEQTAFIPFWNSVTTTKYDIEIEANFLYVNIQGTGIEYSDDNSLRFDLTDPLSPKRSGLKDNAFYSCRFENILTYPDPDGNYCLGSYNTGFEETIYYRLALVRVTEPEERIWDILAGDYLYHGEVCTISGEAVRDICTDGSYAYLSISHNGFSTINLETGSETVFELMCNTYGLEKQEDFVFITCGNSGLKIVDVTEQTNPELIGSLENLGDIRDLYIFNNLAYLIAGSDIKVVNISDPANPEYMNTISASYEIKRICYHNGYLYLIEGVNGLEILDLTSPNNTLDQVALEHSPQISDIDFYEDFVYIMCFNGYLDIYQYNDISDFTFLKSFGSYSLINKMAILDDYLIGTNYKLHANDDSNYAIEIYNLENPEESYEFNIEAFDLYSKIIRYENFIYLMSQGTIKIFDFSNPTSPNLVSTINCVGVNEMFVNNQTLFVFDACSPNGRIQAYNLDSPGDPALISENEDILSGIISKDFQVANDKLFIVDQITNSIVVIDISTPDNITTEANYNNFSIIQSIIADDNFLYTLTHNNLYIWDYSDSETLQLINTIEDCMILQLMAGQNNYLYYISLPYQAPYEVLNILNMSDPNNPLSVGRYRLEHNMDIEGFSGCFSVSQNYIYISDRHNTALTILDCSQALDVDENYQKITLVPSDFAINKTFPNPFNPSLNVEISLPQTGNLEVSIFNLLGQKVANLANQPYSAGTHSFTFNGSNLASGAYFVKASMPEQNTQLQKVILIK